MVPSIPRTPSAVVAASTGSSGSDRTVERNPRSPSTSGVRSTAASARQALNGLTVASALRHIACPPSKYAAAQAATRSTIRVVQSVPVTVVATSAAVRRRSRPVLAGTRPTGSAVADRCGEPGQECVDVGRLAAERPMASARSLRVMRPLSIASR